MTVKVQDFRGRLHKKTSSVLEPVGRILAQLGLSPNQVTWAGVLLNLAAAGLIINESLVAGGIIWLFGGLLDLLDGSMARGQKKASPFGAYLDSTTDRISDGAVFSAIIYHFALLREPIHAAVASLALLSAFLTSYTRARAQSLNIECKGGLITRVERIVLVGFGLCFNWLVATIYVLVVLSIITVGQRIFDAKHQLRDDG
jgi:CDP-diacylglycerol--glycerol-3-phosphate 3-phosphatidyltransferase